MIGKKIGVAKRFLYHWISQGPVVIACPTCGRTQIDLESLAAQVERLSLA